MPNRSHAGIYVHRIGRTARAGAEGISISFYEAAFVRDIEKLIRMSIPATNYPSLTRRAQQLAEKSRSTRPPDHAFDKPRSCEDKPASPKSIRATTEAPTGLPAFLYRTEEINAVQKKANPMRFTVNE